MANPHVLAIPYPAQGHVLPAMEVAQCLVKHGVKVTFANTEFIHERVVNAISNTGDIPGLMHLTAIPDGLQHWEDRNDLGKLTKSILEVMPGELEALIERINASEGEKVTCVLADYMMSWSMVIAKKLGLKGVMLWPAAAAVRVATSSVSNLIADGIIDSEGKLLKDTKVSILPNLPHIETRDLFWFSVGDAEAQKIIFDLIIKSNEWSKLADRSICNSVYDLEPEALSFFHDFKPIGPLLASNRVGKTVGYFWPEDSTCLEWLDRQQKNSVIYAAFGSFTLFDPTQFQEIALGLELTNKPFLWVVRQGVIDDTNKTYLEGFRERVRDRGLMVNWAPQQKVLSHPSVACFISHCGWNSTIEGISNGIPFLCWPYFTDQFFNRDYICDHWKVGLKVEKDENGIVRQEEIRNKVAQLLDDGKFKEKALDIHKKLISGIREGGTSYINLKHFVEWVKD